MTYEIPEGYTKDELFGKPSLATLRRMNVITARGGILRMAQRIDELSPDESYCITNGLITDMTARYFKENAPIIDIGHGDGALTPRERLANALSFSRKNFTSGYGWHGSSDDARMRVVPFVKVLNGAKLFAYESHKMPGGERSDTRLYDDTVRVQTQGGLAAVHVSRRFSKGERHRVFLSGLPVDNPGVWPRLNAHSTCCIDNLFSNARYVKDYDAERKIFCTHEVAAYWKAAEVLYHKHGTDVAARYSPFMVPSQQLIDFYKKLSEQTFVLQRKGKRQSYRPTNEAEMEKLLLTYIREHSFESCFGERGKLAQRRWAA